MVPEKNLEKGLSTILPYYICVTNDDIDAVFSLGRIGSVKVTPESCLNPENFSQLTLNVICKKKVVFTSHHLRSNEALGTKSCGVQADKDFLLLINYLEDGVVSSREDVFVLPRKSEEP